MTLTGHGELLVAHANRAIALNEEALTQVREASISSPVRLGVSEEAALGQLTPALKRFHRTHPDVELKLTVTGPTELDFLMAQGQLDFVIGDLTRVAGQPVTEWNSHLAWFAGTDRAIDPYSPLPLVLSQNLSSWREPILNSLRGAGRGWRIVLEGANLDSTIAAVESGLGVSALLREMVRHACVRELKNSGLPQLPEINFGLFRSNTAPTKAQSLFASAIAASFKSAKVEPLTDSAETRAWLSSDRSERQRIAIS